jgi:hypothetical protein
MGPVDISAEVTLLLEDIATTVLYVVPVVVSLVCVLYCLDIIRKYSQ